MSKPMPKKEIKAIVEERFSGKYKCILGEGNMVKLSVAVRAVEKMHAEFTAYLQEVMSEERIREKLPKPTCGYCTSFDEDCDRCNSNKKLIDDCLSALREMVGL